MSSGEMILENEKTSVELRADKCTAMYRMCGNSRCFNLVCFCVESLRTASELSLSGCSTHLHEHASSPQKLSNIFPAYFFLKQFLKLDTFT